MKPPFALRHVFGSIVCGVTCLVVADGIPAGEPTVSVDTVLRSSFRRIAGKAAGAAAVFPDSNSKWYDHSVGSPTVDYDGTTYRMWFVGMSRTKDPRIPYGFDERIGLFTSTDGIGWKVANGGRPVRELFA